jgi:alpha-methylacyl-CoA racemase
MGPLTGVKVVEIVGLGPGPFGGMLLADMGAEVLRVDRVQEAHNADRSQPATSALNRGKRSIGIDLKKPEGLETLLRLIDDADAFFEVFRPGVAERLGFGPDVCLARNPRLIYGRLTGWGQEGPNAQAAGHDIDYIALAGALEPLGRAGQPPTPPICVLGDFAGGGMLLAWGIVCALVERAASGKGQVIDAAMVDGAAQLLTPFYAARQSGYWGQRGTNHLDTGAPWYDSYETADAKWVAIGAVEPHFYAELLQRIGAVDIDASRQYDTGTWPALRAQFTDIFRTKSRDEWCALLEGTDSCFAPVLEPTEARHHPHAVARNSFLEINGALQPAPAPRFSRTPAAEPAPPTHIGEDTDTALVDWGFSPAEVAKLRDVGAIA